MSKILDKPFDRENNKILRTVFRGAPNLFTSPDLNHQIEALKFQMAQVEKRTGVTSDVTLSVSKNGSILNIISSCTYMWVKGCNVATERFNTTYLLNENAFGDGDTMYVYVRCSELEYTFETDPSHEISGAKFEDGTSLPAADKIVLQAGGYAFKTELSADEDDILIAKIHKSGGVSLFTSKKEDAPIREITNMDSSAVGSITKGTPYDKAFSIIENRFSNFSPTWKHFKTSSGADINLASYCIQNGILYICIGDISVKTPITSSTHTIKLGEFEQDVKLQLLKHFSKLYNSVISNYVWVPYGYVTTATVVGVDNDGKRIFGSAMVSIIVEYNLSGAATDVFLGITQTQCFVDTTPEYTPVDTFNLLKYTTTVKTNRGFSAVPLFGPNI